LKSLGRIAYEAHAKAGGHIPMWDRHQNAAEHWEAVGRAVQDEVMRRLVPSTLGELREQVMRLHDKLAERLRAFEGGA
jgi:hypothetical protein